MTSLLGFWPLRKFFEYVFNRSFGKFLKNKIDFNLHDFSKDRISFAKLEINTQVS